MSFLLISVAFFLASVGNAQNNILHSVNPDVDSECYTPRLAKKFLTDGKTTTRGDLDYWHSCGGNAWAKFQLRELYTITEVRISNRCGCCNTRLTGSKVFVEVGGQEVQCGQAIPQTAQCATAVVKCSIEKGSAIVLRGNPKDTLNVVEVAATGHLSYTGTTTTSTTTTTSPPFWAAWVKGAVGENCVTICAEQECLENQWPTSEQGFRKILKDIGDDSCTSVDTGDWGVNPGQYHDYGNVCYWGTTDLTVQTRCESSKRGIARYCPCAARPSTTITSTTTSSLKVPVPTTTTSLASTTSLPPAIRRRGLRGRRRRARRGRRRFRPQPPGDGDMPPRQRRRRGKGRGSKRRQKSSTSAVGVL